MEFKILLLGAFFQLMVLNNFAICSEVPVILWNVKGDSLQIKPVSAFGNNKQIFDESMKDTLQKTSSSLLVFSVNKLSLEDFSAKEKASSSNNTLQSLETFLDTHPHMLLPSVKDPLNRIHKAHCDVEEIIVDQGIDENVLKSVATALERSCAVILHVSDTSIITKDTKPDFEHIRNVFLPSFEKNKKHVVGMFSGMKSSWEDAASDHHSFRNLLEVEAADETHFTNFTGCIYAYSASAVIKSVNISETNMTYPPDTEGSECSNDVSAILQLKFSAEGNITSLTLKFEFAQTRNSWLAENITMTAEGPQAPEGDTKMMAINKIDAPLGYSYSCGNLVLKAKDEDDPETGIRITLTGFQVQPFEVKEKFSESFDCVTWFTIPIWSGVFVALLFITIIHAGVYALFSINTMDRFDDPKGKTITVAAATD